MKKTVTQNFVVLHVSGNNELNCRFLRRSNAYMLLLSAPNLVLFLGDSLGLIA